MKFTEDVHKAFTFNNVDINLEDIYIYSNGNFGFYGSTKEQKRKYENRFLEDYVYIFPDDVEVLYVEENIGEFKLTEDIENFIKFS